MGGISSLVGIGMHILGKQFTVFVHACCKVEFDRMTGPGVAESFFSADIQFDWSAANLRGQKGIQRFIENVLLISETSADIRLDDTYLPHGIPSAWPMTRRTICGICVEVTTTILPFSM